MNGWLNKLVVGAAQIVGDTMLKDEIGNTYHRLTVAHRGPNTKDGSARWVCQCSCGNVTLVRGDCLRDGHTKSCGCLDLEVKTKHGDQPIKHDTPYGTWDAMCYRCSHHSKRSKYWYDKGIKVCDEWKDYAVFKAWSLAHGWKKGLTIDRIDSNGDYCPENCQWITREENTRKSTKGCGCGGQCD